VVEQFAEFCQFAFDVFVDEGFELGAGSAVAVQVAALHGMFFGQADQDDVFLLVLHFGYEGAHAIQVEHGLFFVFDLPRVGQEHVACSVLGVGR
jgi:hypothetical protein